MCEDLMQDNVIVNKNGGAIANRNGTAIEESLIPFFQRLNFRIFFEKDIKKNPLLLNNLDKYILRDVKYKSIYGSNRCKTEYLIVDKERRVRVEMKFQVSAGSVDEKYPYMLLNAIEAYPEKEIIFVVDGGGYKIGALNWLREHIDNNWLNYKEKGKDIKLMNIGEFNTYFIKEFCN